LYLTSKQHLGKGDTTIGPFLQQPQRLGALWAHTERRGVIEGEEKDGESKRDIEEKQNWTRRKGRS